MRLLQRLSNRAFLSIRKISVCVLRYIRVGNNINKMESCSCRGKYGSTKSECKALVYENRTLETT